jgi:hypothetical protein
MPAAVAQGTVVRINVLQAVVDKVAAAVSAKGTATKENAAVEGGAVVDYAVRAAIQDVFPVHSAGNKGVWTMLANCRAEEQVLARAQFVPNQNR